MEALPQTLPELRAHLVQLGARRLDIDQRIRAVPEGPGYYDAVQPLKAQQQEVDTEFKATQQKINLFQKPVHPTLF
jgi:hypothetical protein